MDISARKDHWTEKQPEKLRQPFEGWVYLDTDNDLSPTFIEDQDIPDWLWYEIEQVGLKSILLYTYDPLHFALVEGIAPGQCFKVQIHPPTYYRDYYGEWDSEIAWSLLQKCPFTDAQALATWVHWLSLDGEKIIWVGA